MIPLRLSHLLCCEREHLLSCLWQGQGVTEGPLVAKCFVSFDIFTRGPSWMESGNPAVARSLGADWTNNSKVCTGNKYLAHHQM